MRKFLKTLPATLLLKIANDLGYEGTDQKAAAEHIIESAKAYRWSISDLRNRFIG